MITTELTQIYNLFESSSNTLSGRAGLSSSEVRKRGVNIDRVSLSDNFESDFRCLLHDLAGDLV